MATIARRDRTTRPAGILVVIKDQDRSGIGRYAGWGSDEDGAERPQREEQGPSILPRRIRAFGLLWIPAVIVVITIELWLRLPQVVAWISLAGLFAAFMLLSVWTDRKPD